MKIDHDGQFQNVLVKGAHRLTACANLVDLFDVFSAMSKFTV